MSIRSSFDISGKTALVTGATGSLGGEMACMLAAEGARVAVVSRTAERSEAAAARIRDAGGEAEPFAGDVQQRSDVERIVQGVKDKWGRLDILVNAAGGNDPGATAGPDLKFFDLPADALENVMRLNLLGTIFPCQVAGAVMASQGAGCIVNISSMAAVLPLTRVIGYSATKAGINNFTYWLAVHMAQEYSVDIRVNAIAPGFFETDQNRFLLRDRESGELSERGQKIVDHTPMARFGDADELLGALLWLASPASKFVTGIVVPVDGGFSAYAGV
jgi:NAD(P)-dependent dehydrogenase (short-subunit alcohol dehydrogenase family)